MQYMRLKEWNHYLIYNEDYGFALTIGKTARFSSINAAFLDFNKSEEITKKAVIAIPFEKTNLTESSLTGNISYQDNKIYISFKHECNTRKLHIQFKNNKGITDFAASFELSNEAKESVVISKPFIEDKKAFYDNKKIIGINASGNVSLNGKSYNFNKENSRGLLNWSRGFWPKKVNCYWSAGQGIIKGSSFGFNLGYGFGNSSTSTENTLFYNGIAHKLEHVKFIIPRNRLYQYDYMKPWIIVSSDHRFEMDFIPIIDHSVILSAIVLSTDQHQVFGKFTGRAILDDCTIIELKDFLGFASKIKYKW